MSAYVLFGLVDVSDPAGLAAYRASAPQTMEGRGVRFVAGPKIAETLEGEPLQGAVILEFPSVEEARAWYRSPAYQQAAEHRWGASRCFALILESRPAPA
jgi:uncharacterized protein (DUF1330 family)